MGTQLSTSKQVRHWLDRPEMKQRIGDALGGFMSGDMFLAQVALAVQDPNIAKCSPTSVFNSMLEVATMGLLPGKSHGHVALIPRKGMLTVLPQWQGLKYLMERQSHVRQVKALLVHDSDTIRVEQGIVVEHSYDPFAGERRFQHWSQGESGLKGGYVKVEYTDGTLDYHFVPAAKIKANADCAQNQSNWRKWFPEYCLKTLYRDCYARRAIRLEPETEGRLGRVAAVIDREEQNDPQRGGHAVRPSERPKPVKGQDALAAALAPQEPPAQEPQQPDVQDAEFEPEREALSEERLAYWRKRLRAQAGKLDGDKGAQEAFYRAALCYGLGIDPATVREEPHLANLVEEECAEASMWMERELSGN